MDGMYVRYTLSNRHTCALLTCFSCQVHPNSNYSDHSTFGVSKILGTRKEAEDRSSDEEREAGHGIEINTRRIVCP